MKTNQQNITPTCPKQQIPELINTCPPVDEESKQNSSPCCIEAQIIETYYDCLEEECNDSILIMGEKLKPKEYKTPDNPRSNPNKKKQGNPEERYKNGEFGKQLTYPEARKIATDLGYWEVKDHPCETDEITFYNGKNYISPDRDSHSGGSWKLFDKDGQRLKTCDKYLQNIVGK